MTRKIEDILNNCLERLFRGESIRDCLESYPEQASELELLLRTSVTIIQTSSAIQPAPQFKTRVRSQFEAILRQGGVKAEKAKIPLWGRKWAVAVASVVLVFLVGIGITAASTSVLPDESLYSVKLSAEQARLALTLSDAGKAKLHIQFAERRAGEVAEMARQGKSEKILVLAEQVANHLGKVYEAEKTGEIEQGTPRALAPPPDKGAEDYSAVGGYVKELTKMLDESRGRSLRILESALEEAPPRAKPSLQQAIEEIRADYDEALFKIESGSN